MAAAESVSSVSFGSSHSAATAARGTGEAISEGRVVETRTFSPANTLVAPKLPLTGTTDKRANMAEQCFAVVGTLQDVDFDKRAAWKLEWLQSEHLFVCSLYQFRFRMLIYVVQSNISFPYQISLCRTYIILEFCVPLQIDIPFTLYFLIGMFVCSNILGAFTNRFKIDKSNLSMLTKLPGLQFY